jgi:hypothetical protein
MTRSRYTWAGAVFLETSRSKRRTKMLPSFRIFPSVALALVFLWGCSKSLEPSTGSESHFLASCTSTCPDGLDCICGSCTVACKDDLRCGAISSEAECVAGISLPVTLRCSQNVDFSVCDSTCKVDADCTAIDHLFTCQNGFCRSANTTLPQSLSLSDLHGHRYSFRADREWDRSAESYEVFSTAPPYELPDQAFKPLAAPLTYAVTFSEDGDEIELSETDSSAWAPVNHGTKSTNDAKFYIYSFSEALGNLSGSFFGWGGLFVVWIENNGFSAQLDGSGSGVPVVNMQRGILVDSCKTDSDCKQGLVCEPGAGCSTDSNACVPGCHQSTDCGSGEACVTLTCVTCPCPGGCSAGNEDRFRPT